ncbi:Peptidyl-prolyl cis-trans isomerase Pin1 [Papilio machaon]|uniref:Peptidyl-prolyl cis-trans isomerase n=1 Tax=Papilio machaon TaxID=76193 RepID=A0A194QUQ9_PAPMA|nr:Peptidyl-prolyl cis-trans isomerase Pin1 [Papilio machaon]
MAPKRPVPLGWGLRVSKVWDIRLEILSHKITFDEAAFKYSESSTAFSGGKMDPIFKGHDMDEIFDEAAFALEIGEFSQPVETSIGYHIIQRTG